MLTLNDGRSELWQWDTGRKLTVDAECSQVHFSNKIFGRSFDVDVVNGIADIPDVLLQTDKELNAWAFVGTAENGYTKIGKTFHVNKRNKPADYVFTPLDQATLQEIEEKIKHLESIQDPDAIKNAVEDYLQSNPVESPVTSVNNKTGDVKLNADDVGAISQHGLQNATNAALEQAKKSGLFDGAPGADGRDGVGIQSVVQTTSSNEDGGTNIVTVTNTDGTTSEFTVRNGSKGSAGHPGADGKDGDDGYTPVRGVDYWTDADKAQMVSDVLAALGTETLTLTYEDGTTASLRVVVRND